MANNTGTTTEVEKLLEDLEDLGYFVDNHMRDTSGAPEFEDKDEPLYWLLADSQENVVLSALHTTAMNRAIKSKDQGDGQSIWNKYAQLAAPREKYLEAKWTATNKVIRFCNIEKVEYAEKNRNLNSDYDFSKTPYLLEHATHGLSGVEVVNLSLDDRNQCHGHVLTFEKKIQLKVTTITDSKAKKRFFPSQKNTDQEKNKAENGFFYAVVDIDDDDPELRSEDALRLLYGKLSANVASYDAPATKYMGNGADACMAAVAGVVGMEGAVFVRNLRHYPDSRCVATPDAPVIGKQPVKDEMWGGTVFVLFLISVFQRKRLEMIAAEESKNWGTMRKGDDYSVLKDQLEQILRLDNVWMYHEMAGRTDIDHIYTVYQNALDIPKMWKDIRDQMKRVSDYLEQKTNTIVSNSMNFMAVVGMPLIILSAIITIGPTQPDGSSAGFVRWGAVSIFVFIILITVLSWHRAKALIPRACRSKQILWGFIAFLIYVLILVMLLMLTLFQTLDIDVILRVITESGVSSDCKTARVLLDCPYFLSYSWGRLL